MVNKITRLGISVHKCIGISISTKYIEVVLVVAADADVAMDRDIETIMYVAM